MMQVGDRIKVTGRGSKLFGLVGTVLYMRAFPDDLTCVVVWTGDDGDDVVTVPACVSEDDYKVIGRDRRALPEIPEPLLSRLEVVFDRAHAECDAEFRDRVRSDLRPTIEATRRRIVRDMGPATEQAVASVAEAGVSLDAARQSLLQWVAEEVCPIAEKRLPDELQGSTVAQEVFRQMMRDACVGAVAEMFDQAVGQKGAA